MSKIHLEILDEKRQDVFQRLKPFAKHGCLAGGTALALQINHRRSVDFDVFITHPVDRNFIRKVKRIFGAIYFYVNTSKQVSFHTNGKVGVTFVRYDFKALYSSVPTKSLPLARIEDIATDKAYTIGRRAMWRDYVDVFFLLKKKLITINQIITSANKKFEGEFVQTQFLQQLTYYEDLNVMPIEYINTPHTPEEIKKFLGVAVRGYLKKILP